MRLLVYILLIVGFLSSCASKRTTTLSKNPSASTTSKGSNSTSSERKPTSTTGLSYIDQYKNIAIAEMEKYGIPASIKLAQALLESGNGNSTLARDANNHFGIKCGGTWKGKLMLISDPSRVTLAQTRYQFERGDLVKTMVQTHNARAGINAGGFVDGPNYDSNGGTPAGLLIVNNELIQSNGNMKHSVIGFNQDNVLVLGKMTKQEALDANLRDAVDFRPFLIVNGEKTIKEGTGGWGIAPRTAIGQRKTGEVLFLCIDGRQPGHSLGTDLDVLQNTLYDEGCINAAMLDGGSSTVMYYKDDYVNKPSLGHERYINNAWIIK